MRSFLMVIVGIIPLCTGRFASFVNLDFDSADTNGLTLFGPVSRLLPGWTFERGGNREDLIGLDAIGPTIGFASIYSFAIRQRGFTIPVEGRFSLGMFPAPHPSGGAFLQYSLSQTGDIPADANTIRFTGFGSQLELRINDTVVPL